MKGSTQPIGSCHILLQVTGAFGSSMEVMISVCGETPTIGEVFHCGDAYATVVSVDTKGNPVELPFELRPDSPADKLRCAEAAYRSACAVQITKSLLKARVVCSAGHIS